MRHLLFITHLILAALLVTPVISTSRISCPCDSEPSVEESLYDDSNVAALRVIVRRKLKKKSPDGFTQYMAKVVIIYKGEPRQSEGMVVLKTKSDLCGVGLDPPGPYLIFATEFDGQSSGLDRYTINDCAANDLWDDISQEDKLVVINYDEDAEDDEGEDDDDGNLTLVIKALEDDSGQNNNQEFIREIVAPIEITYTPLQDETPSFQNVTKVKFYQPPVLEKDPVKYIQKEAADDLWDGDGEDSVGSTKLFLSHNLLSGSIITKDFMYQLSTDCDGKLVIVGRAKKKGNLRGSLFPLKGG